MGYPYQISASVGTTKVRYSMDRVGPYKLPGWVEALEIENTHATNDLYISFDFRGAEKRTLGPGDVWSIDTYSDKLKRGLVREFTVWGSAAGTTFEITVLITEPRD